LILHPEGRGHFETAAITAAVIAAGATAYAAHSAASSNNAARQQAAQPTSSTTNQTSTNVRGTPAVQAADANALTTATNVYNQMAAQGGKGIRGASGAGKLSQQLAQQLYNKAQEPVANLGAADGYVGQVLGQGGSAGAQPGLGDLPAVLQQQVKSGKLTLAAAIEKAAQNPTAFPEFNAKFGAAIASAAGSPGAAALAFNPVAQGLYNSVTSPTGAIATENQQLEDFYNQGGGAAPGGLASFAKTGIVPSAVDPSSALGQYENAVLSNGYLDPSTNPALAGVMKAIQDAEQTALNPQLAALTGQANKMGMYGGSGFAVGEEALQAKALQQMDDEMAQAQEAEFNQGRTIQEQVASQESAANQAALQTAEGMRGQNLTALGDISDNNKTGLTVQQGLAQQLDAARQAAVGDVGTLSAAGMAPASTAWQASHGNDQVNEAAGAVNAGVSEFKTMLPENTLNDYLSQLNLLGGQNTTSTENGTTVQTHDPSANVSDPTAAAITGGLGGALGAYGLLGGQNGTDNTGGVASTNPGGALMPGVVGASQNPSGYAGNPAFAPSLPVDPNQLVNIP
jgi:hypothetical protein